MFIFGGLYRGVFKLWRKCHVLSKAALKSIDAGGKRGTQDDVTRDQGLAVPARLSPALHLHFTPSLNNFNYTFAGVVYVPVSIFSPVGLAQSEHLR